MKLSFIPKEERFFELFEEQAGNIVKAAGMLVELVGDHAQVDEICQQIEQVEHEGDIVTHEIADRLNRTFVTPLDHEDIHALAGRLDDVLDYIEATADRMVLYEAGEPTAEMRALADVLSEACKALESAARGMADIPRNARRILDYCIEIHRLENIADDQSRRALATLFKGSDALHALKWKEIYDHVEEAIDRCEEVAVILEGIVVKHT
jgi:predicted phosphate transport protein (TIGR00153 family)